MANPFDLLLPCPCSHPAAITMSWSSTARNQTVITSASTLVWGGGWYLLCTALLLPVSLPGPHLRLFPLWAVPFLCPPLPHLPDLIWRMKQVLRRDRGRLRKVSQPWANDDCSFFCSQRWTSQADARWEQEASQNLRTLVDETEIVLSA